MQAQAVTPSGADAQALADALQQWLATNSHPSPTLLATLQRLSDSIAHLLPPARMQELHLNSEKLAHAEQLMSTIVDTIPAMVFLKRASDLRFESFNRAGEELLGFHATDLIGKNDYDFFPKEQADFFTSEDRKVLAGNNALEIPEEIITTAKGEQRILHTRKIAVRNRFGHVTHLLGVSLDITDRKKYEAQIETLAFFDPLTGLPNRRLMQDRLLQTMASSKRSGKQGALMMIDLDNFKTLNDTMGHELGDQLLIEVAHRLRIGLRDGDTVARLGGDEFIVLLHDLHENDQAIIDAKKIARKIQSDLRQPYLLRIKTEATSEATSEATEATNEATTQATTVPHMVPAAADNPPVAADTPRMHTHHCTASIGITLFRGGTINADELLKRADTAMYQAKRAGRDTLRFFDPAMQEAAMARSAMEQDLRNALVGNQLLLHYQPQVDEGGRVVGAEALLRWQHPQRGLVPPAEFITQAEESGLIVPIGAWVLRTACEQLAKWASRDNLAHLTLAVNVSARQFSHPTFVAEVMADLQASHARADRLKLELTESLLFENTEEVIEKMLALKKLNIKFSLDDFGTGFSSLSYLKRLPLSQLKIDRSFVRDILSDPNDAAIAKTIVALADSLGLEVIAEGVEMAEQRDFLASVGCKLYQGYHFCRPLALPQFEAWVAATTTTGSIADGERSFAGPSSA
jgi:diguanylate cyclase (GGDEF)-like protein/PAS domain S-box-containing protein